MPTVKRFARSRIEIHPDEHPPPHFHIWTCGGESISVSLDTFVITGTADPRDTREAIRWAREHRAALIDWWGQYTGLMGRR